MSVNNEDLGSSHEVLEDKGRDELKEMRGLGDTDIVAEIGLPKAGVAAAFTLTNCLRREESAISLYHTIHHQLITVQFVKS